MSKLKYPKLNEPIKLGKNVYRNRLFSSPQDYPGLTAEGFLTEQGCYFYERKAMGGFSSVTVGDFMIDPDHGRTHPFQMRGLDLRSKVNLGRCSQAIKRHGAVAAVELCHGGENANTAMYPDGDTGIAYGPDEKVREDGTIVRALNDEQIEALIQNYIDAASFCVQCGFNHIVLHGGHGWQISQFMSPTFNHRTDKWGGSVENRMRFPLAVCEGIRKEVGRGIPIEFRLSGSETLPWGYDIDEGIAMSKMLDGNVDIIHVSVGHHEIAEAVLYTHPTMFMEDGVNLHYAADVKKHVETPVATVGAFTDLDHMEEVLASGQADIICLGRQSLSDPDIPLKARLGKPEEVTPCMRCFECFSNSTINGVFYCAVNPEIGREETAIFTNPARVQKKVLVIGGGPAGMQAALTCSKQGHKVILAEKTDKLGGCLLCEEKVPFKQNLETYLNRQAGKVERDPNIEVYKNTEATPEWAEKQNADVIIAALGSVPLVLPIEGIEKALCADDVYINPDKAGDTVAIMGGGLVGLELGIYLAGLGKKATIVEMTGSTPATPQAAGTSTRMAGLMGLPAGYPLVHGDALAMELKKYPDQLEVKLNTRAMKVTDEGLVVDEQGVGEHTIAADTVVYAVGQKPLTDQAHAFSECAEEFYSVGDCVSAANILNATSTAYQISLDIGRF